MASDEERKLESLDFGCHRSHSLPDDGFDLAFQLKMLFAACSSLLFFAPLRKHWMETNLMGQRHPMPEDLEA